MASVEPIALESYPVWIKQPSEPAEKYQIFERYFLPFPRPNLTGAYRRYLEDQGEEGRGVDDANGQWKRDCDRYLWRDRHTAFWRAKNHSDAEWREEQIRQYQSESLDTARLLRLKAGEILENFDVASASPKDAAALLRLAGDLVSDALDWRDIDRAVSACHRWGFEVIQPESDTENG
ncbi:MAG: hypothetical protein ACK5QS_07765 [Pseudanabaenaceae cyanobacterium]